MSDVEISQILAQMRVLKAQAQQAPPPVDAQAPADMRPAFSEVLQNSIDKVASMQKASGDMHKAFEAGDPNVDLTQVMIALQKAGVSFKAMTEVRNKLVDAYKDVMNMPI